MEQSLVHLAESAAWVFFIIFVFAVIGVVATVRWIINMVWGAEQAVESGVRSVEDKLTHRD